MKFKRFGAMLLALVMCTGVFSTTVFAYSDESATTTTTEKAETVETLMQTMYTTMRTTVTAKNTRTRMMWTSSQTMRTMNPYNQEQA